MENIAQLKEDLYDILVSVSSREDCKILLDDLCTNKEVEQMAQRAYAAKLFLEGKTYAQITEEIDISSRAVSITAAADMRNSLRGMYDLQRREIAARARRAVRVLRIPQVSHETL